MTKLRGHTQIKVEGWGLNVISHRLPSRAKGGGGNVQNYELSNNARFPSRTKRNRTEDFFFSFSSSPLFRFSNVPPREGGNIQTALSRPSIRFIDQRREEGESRDSTNLIVMMDTSEVKSATTTPRKREGGGKTPSRI